MSESELRARITDLMNEIRFLRSHLRVLERDAIYDAAAEVERIQKRYAPAEAALRKDEYLRGMRAGLQVGRSVLAYINAYYPPRETGSPPLRLVASNHQANKESAGSDPALSTHEPTNGS